MCRCPADSAQEWTGVHSNVLQQRLACRDELYLILACQWQGRDGDVWLISEDLPHRSRCPA